MTGSPAEPPASVRSPTSLQRQLPNALTIGRVLLAAAFFAVLTPWTYSHSPLATGHTPDWWLLSAALLFAIAAATDALDGFLARRWNVVSPFGRIMDPFADKVLVIGAFVYLAGPGFARPDGSSASGVAPWMVVVILARELLVTSIRAVFESRGIAFPATASGKAKMILQSIVIPAVLLLIIAAPTADHAGSAGWAATTRLALVWTTVLVTAWSALPYVLRAVRTSAAPSPR